MLIWIRDVESSAEAGPGPRGCKGRPQERAEVGSALIIDHNSSLTMVTIIIILIIMIPYKCNSGMRKVWRKWNQVNFPSWKIVEICEAWHGF